MTERELYKELRRKYGDTTQQYRTFKGQIEAGDIKGFSKGLGKVLRETKK